MNLEPRSRCGHSRGLSYTIIFYLGNEIICYGLGTYNAIIAYDRNSVGADGFADFPVGTTATVRCEPGYSQTGSRVRTCQSDGTWSGNTACIGNQINI